MAFCVLAPRNLFLNTLCRRLWSESSFVVDGKSGFMLKAGVGAGWACCGVQVRAQDSIRVPTCRSNSNRASSFSPEAKNSMELFASGKLSASSGIRNVLDSFRFTFVARSLHESQSRQSFEDGEHNVEEEENAELVEEEEEFGVLLEGSKADLKAGLYLVGTPIGNLEDITLRALRVLKSAAMILAEDTRHSSRLLRHYGIRTPTMSYHKFNEIARRDMIIERLRRGEVLALISDAGMPGISDPGSDIVRACVEANVDIFPIPGPSAVITGLVASGLPTNEFSFVGFLPSQSSSRQRRLATAANESLTQVFYIPPHKLGRILDECISAFGPSRRCAVAREMTKLHEEFWRGTLEQAQTEFKLRSPRGEITFIVEGVPKGSRDQPVDEDELKCRLQSLMDAGKSPSEATKQVVLETSARKNTVYTLALSMKQKY